MSWWPRNKALRYSVFGVLGACVMVGLGFIVMGLWNWLVPELFHGPTVSWLQSLGLLVLCRVLVGGLGGDNSGSGNKPAPESDKIDHLSDEERARLRELLRERMQRTMP